MTASALPIRWEVVNSEGVVIGRVSRRHSAAGAELFMATPPNGSSFTSTNHSLLSRAMAWLESQAGRPQCETCHSLEGMPCDPQQHRRAGTEVKL